MMVGWGLLSLFTGLGLGGACSTCIQGAAGGQEDIIAGSREKVGVVELNGAIMDVSDFVRDVRAFAKRDDLRALVVRIDSPGGAVGPSQEAYDALRFAAKKKVVVVSMGTVAASGGFWTAMAGDFIYANPGTITGSIGVITQLPDLRGIADALRFSMHTFKSGPLKDAGNPLREMTPADAAMFQSMIDDIYAQFVGVVAERRGLDIEAVKKLADGRVITGRAAKEAGLVDEMGGLYDAAKKAIALANERDAAKSDEAKTSTITDLEKLEDPTLVYPKKPMPTVLEMLTGGAQSAIARGLSEGIERAAASAEERATSGKVELR